MKEKKIKIILEDLRHINGITHSFKVKKITNSIEFKINEYLNENQVDDLIKYNADTTIEIVEKR